GYREELLFFFQELTEGASYGQIGPVSVLVYAQMRKVKPEAGMLQRGGLGKLAAMARTVIHLPETEEEKALKTTEVSGTDSQSVSEVSIEGLRIHPTTAEEVLRMPIYQNRYS